MTFPDALRTEVHAFIAKVWRDVERFLRDTGMAPTMFSRAAARDPNLIRHIREGRRRLTLNMALRLQEFMDKHHREDARR
jgi:tRNA-dihydrouridine synthase